MFIDFCFWPTWNNRDNGNNNNKDRQNTWNNRSKTLDIRWQRTVIPGRWKINEVSLLIVPVYCLERVSSLQQRKENLRWSPADFLSQGWSWESGESKAAGVHRTDHQRGQVCRGSPTSTQEHRAARVCEETPQGQGKNPLKGWRE